VKPVITKLSESKIKSGSNLGPKKKGNTSKSLKKKEIKQENVTIDNPGHSSEVKTESQRVNSRTKRTRTTTSKYGDEMYLGDDFVLDSEEEIEIEKKSKRKRKVSGDPRSTFKIKSVESAKDSEEDVEIENKSKKKQKTSGDVKSNLKIKSETDDSVDILDSF
jgi:glucan-binding YG repeat protein